jgi:hypothetical protein
LRDIDGKGAPGMNEYTLPERPNRINARYKKEVKNLLKAKYGGRFQSLKPTDRSVSILYWWKRLRDPALRLIQSTSLVILVVFEER